MKGLSTQLKRLLSVMLTVAMVLTSFSLPTKVYAADTDSDTGAKLESTYAYLKAGETTTLTFSSTKNNIDDIAAPSAESTSATIGLSANVSNRIAGQSIAWKYQEAGDAGATSISGSNVTVAADKKSQTVTFPLSASLAPGQYTITVTFTKYSTNNDGTCTAADEVSVDTKVSILKVDGTSALTTSDNLTYSYNLKIGTGTSGDKGNTLSITDGTTAIQSGVAWTFDETTYKDYLSVTPGSNSTGVLAAKKAYYDENGDAGIIPITGTVVLDNRNITFTVNVTITAEAVDIGLKNENDVIESSLELLKGETETLTIVADPDAMKENIYFRVSSSTTGVIGLSAVSGSADAEVYSANDKLDTESTFAIKGVGVGSTTLTVGFYDAKATEESLENKTAVLLKEKTFSITVKDEALEVETTDVWLKEGGDTATISVKDSKDQTVKWTITGNNVYIDGGTETTATGDSVTITSNTKGGLVKDATVTSSLGDSTDVKTTTKVSIFGLEKSATATSNGAATVELDADAVAAGTPGVYKTEMAFVTGKTSDSSFAEMMTVKLMEGDTERTTAATWKVTSGSDVVSVGEKTGVITALKGGNAVVTATYTNAQLNNQTGASVTLTLNITVKDYTFTIDPLAAISLSQNTSAYYIEPTVAIGGESAVSVQDAKTSFKTDSPKQKTEMTTGETLATNIVFKYTVSGGASQTELDKISVSDDSSTFVNAVYDDQTRGGTITIGAANNTEATPFTIKIDGYVNNIDGVTSSRLVTSQTVTLNVITAVTSAMILPKTKTSYFMSLGDASKTISITRLTGATNASLGVACSDDSTADSTVAVSLSGNTITVVPRAIGTTMIYLYDKGKGPGSGNHLNEYAITVFGFSTPASGDSKLVPTQEKIGDGYTGEIYIDENGAAKNSVAVEITQNAANVLKFTVGSNSVLTSSGGNTNAIDLTSTNARIADASSSQADVEYASNDIVSLIWSSSNEKAATVEAKGASGDDSFVATITPVAAGTTTITATLSITSADKTTVRVFDRTVISTTITVYDYSKVSITGVDDSIVLVTSGSAKDGYKSSKIIAPSVSSAYSGVAYKFEIPFATNGASITEDTANATSVGHTYTYVGTQVTIMSADGLETNNELTITAQIGTGSNAKVITQKKVTIYTIKRDENILYSADGTRTYGTQAAMLQTDGSVTGNIFAVTNALPDGLTSKATINDLTDGSKGIYALSEGWSIEEGSTSLSSIADSGQMALTAVYKYSGTKGTYTDRAEVILKVATLKELKAAGTYNAKAFTAGSSVSLNTSAGKVAITGITPVYSDGGTVAATYLPIYNKKMGIASGYDWTAKSSNEKVATLDAKPNAADGAVAITVTDTAGKSVVTIGTLGQTATININNVKSLATFGTDLAFTTSVSTVKVESANVLSTATAPIYYVPYSEGLTVTLSQTVSGEDSLTVKAASSTAAVATVPSATIKPGTNNKVEVTITAKGPGYTDITLTSNDSVKTKETIGLYLIQNKAEIVDMSLDAACKYDANTIENYIDVSFTGAGYGLKALTLDSAKLGETDAKKYFTLSDAVTDAAAGTVDYYLTLNGTPAEGTYDLTFTATEANILTTKGTDKTETLTAKVTIAGRTFKKGEFTVKQNTVPNYFYKYNAADEDTFATLVFSGKNVDVGEVKLENTSVFKLVGASAATGYVTATNGEVKVQLNQASLKTDKAISDAIKKGANRKLTFSVKPYGYSTTVQVTMTLKANYKAPTLKLSEKSGIFYTGLGTDAQKTVETTMTRSDGVAVGAAYKAQLVDKKDVDYTGTTNGKYTLVNNDGVLSITASTGVSTVKGFIKVTELNKGTTWAATDAAIKAAYTATVDTKTSTSIVLSSKTITLNNGTDYIGKEADIIHISLKGGSDMSDNATKTITVIGDKKSAPLIGNSVKIERGAAAAGNTLTGAVEIKDSTASTQKNTIGDDVKFSLINGLTPGSYKFTISATVGAKTAKQVVTLKVVDTAASAGVKLSTKGKIDVLNPDSAIMVTPKLNGLNGELYTAELTGANKDKFVLRVMNDTGALVAIQETTDPTTKVQTTNLPSSGVVYIVPTTTAAGAASIYSTKTKYSVNVKYTMILSGIKSTGNGTGQEAANTATYAYPTATKPITFKVTNGKMTAGVNPTLPEISVGGTKVVNVYAYHKVKSVEWADVDLTHDGMITPYVVQANNQAKVKITPVTETDALKTTADGNAYGRIKVTPLNAKPGQTISVKLQVYEVGQANDVKPTTVTLKVKIPKTATSKK